MPPAARKRSRVLSRAWLSRAVPVQVTALIRDAQATIVGLPHLILHNSLSVFSHAVTTLLRGLTFLIQHQDLNGYFGGQMYSHALATIALCEAYGMTADPELRPAAQRARLRR